jgi:hypothetical protein
MKKSFLEYYVVISGLGQDVSKLLTYFKSQHCEAEYAQTRKNLTPQSERLLRYTYELSPLSHPTAA